MLIDDLIHQVEQARKNLREHGKDAFFEYAASLFKQYPAIEDFR